MFEYFGTLNFYFFYGNCMLKFGWNYSMLCYFYITLLINQTNLNLKPTLYSYNQIQIYQIISFLKNILF